MAFARLSVSAFALLAFLAPDFAGAQDSVRDMPTPSRWAYQPGDGPARKARERDFFSPASEVESPAASERVVAAPARAVRTAPPVAAAAPARQELYVAPARQELYVAPARQELYAKPAPTSAEAAAVSSFETPSSTAPLSETQIDLELEVSGYKYEAPKTPLSLKGPRGGGGVDGTYALGKGWFAGAQTRLSYGSLDYKGDGHKNGVQDFVFEARALAGRDWVWDNFVLAPFVGVGYRYQATSLRGRTSSGAEGYKRINQLLFIPVGFEPRWGFSGGGSLALRFEFDPLVHGTQQYNLSDLGTGQSDLRAQQKSGYGLRGQVMYRQESWGVGPFISYWNINGSDTKCESGGSPICLREPRNDTLEYGVRLTYRLY